MNAKLIGTLVICAAGALSLGAGTLREWSTRADMAAWVARGGQHQCTLAAGEDGLKAVCSGMDGHVYAPGFTLKASAAQEVVFRAKGTCGGVGELFWMTPGKRPTQSQSTSFQWIGDGQWHEYRIRPFWQGEKTIGSFRIDFPTSASDKGAFTLARIAVEDVPLPSAIDSLDYAGVTFTGASDKPAVGAFCWATDRTSGLKKSEFRIPGDGRRHRYYLDLAGRPAFDGKVVYWAFDPMEGAAVPTDLVWVKDIPDTAPDFVFKSACVSDAISREGQGVKVTFLVGNLGTREAKDVKFGVDLPAGARLANGAELPRTVEGAGSALFNPVITGLAAGDHTLLFSVSAPGVAPVSARVKVTVLPALNLPKAAYVPEPKPAETDYDIGALYFPGWCSIERWQRVWKTCPERKPVLGWYDEANPEVVDWQIKWLVENGIRTLYVDWYWSKGDQHLDHWVKAFYKARYRKCLKWAMMWANHNAPGSHSIEDQKAVTKFWIDNYFNTPEYLRVDGMPVVWMWSPQNMERDLGAGGCRKLLDLSREMARAAGLKGIYFIAMKWPEADVKPSTIKTYKDMGFDMTGIYHFMSHGGRSADNRRYPYSQVADANTANWWGQQVAGVLPFLPNLSTGWDDRPWNDHCEIYGKNAADFRRICASAKEFADKTGVKRLCLAPLNEWGEGSYAEPNAEHGFGFYEAVRDTFCKKPPEGWPANYTPRDVGLGPYDLPMPEKPAPRTAWDLTKGVVPGWHEMMCLSQPRATAEGLVYTTTGTDPAISLTFPAVKAKEWKKVVVRMKTSRAKAALQVFWAGTAERMSESASASLPIVADGAWRDYVFPVAANRTWRGRIGALRIDPGYTANVDVAFAYVKLEK